MVRAFGMNQKVEGSSLPRVEIYYVLKTSALSQEHPHFHKNIRLSAKNESCLLPDGMMV